MASPKQHLLILVLITLTLTLAIVSPAQAHEPSFHITTTADTLDQWEESFYNDDLGESESVDGFSTRRSLFWGKVIHYYISYGALSANRVPCPPRSGRSYYTHNCYKARGPVHPYRRGCSAITRCRR